MRSRSGPSPDAEIPVEASCGVLYAGSLMECRRESWEECTAREVKEETGLAIRNVKFAHVTNTVMRDERRPSHSVTIFMRSELTDPDAEPENLEPEKCEGWEWVEWPHVPQPVFRPLQSPIASNYKLSE